MKQADFDIIIIGGGLVGLAFALSLQHTHFSIALIDSKPSQPLDTSQSRPLSLNETSYQILKNLELWQDLQHNATPIEQVHISERGRFGTIRLRADEAGVAALGYVINIIDLFAALQAKTREQKNLTLMHAASVDDIAFNELGATLSIRDNKGISNLTGSLIVAADGSNSQLVKCLHLRKEQHDYKECAITASVTLSRHHHCTAYERFTSDGTIALLPLDKNTCGLVWSVDAKQKDAILSLSDDDFIQKLQSNIGYRAGHIEKTSARHAHPLRFSRVLERSKNNVVILGNAAQTLHPVAAQGFNLGLIDAVTLCDKIQQHSSIKDAITRRHLLDEFDADCTEHQNKVISFTNILVKIAKNNNPFIALARSLTLNIIGLSPTSRQIISRFGMGKLRKYTKSARTIA